MKSRTLRLAEEADAAEILSIYEPYIRDTVITFEYEVPSVEAFRKRMLKILPEYPFIVCISEGKILGYAYAHRQMERAAYQWNATLSVYVDKNHIRGGVGKALYSALIEILRMQNVRNVYGGVTTPNENSEKLHEYFGFKRLGTYHSTGYKCGAWHDVTWFEKTIGDYDLDPQPFLPIEKVNKQAIMEMLNRYNEPSGFYFSV